MGCGANPWVARPKPAVVQGLRVPSRKRRSMGVFGNDPINAEETGVDGVRELLRHPLSGDTEQERFNSFVQRLRDRDTALALLKEYPVLARHIWLCINQWVDSTCEFLERLLIDAEKISK